tara:strand:+ start:4109 stop:6448 length:2340 start_codon:yes stop_codon:yes gene_type:complete
MAKKKTPSNEYMFGSMGSSYSLTDSQEIEKRGSEFIWYGMDNLFPQHTIQLYQNSATQNALVNSIAAWIYGGGIDADNKEQHPEDWLKFNKLINHKIGKNDIQLMCMDLKLHGGFYISLTYSVDRTEIVEMEVLPFETMRSGHTDEDGNVEWYYHSHDWKAGSRAKYTEHRAFNPHEKATYPNQVLCVKMNSVGSYYYPKPDWIGAWNYVELDVNVAQFHLSQIENGLAPSFIINFANGIPAREKREDIKRTIEAELSGSRNAGKFLCTFSDGRDTTPDIQAVPLSDADKQFQFLSTEITNKIMVGNRVVSPRLFGVNADGGGLGNNAEELQTASALFEQTVVDPFRDVIIDALKMLMAESEVNLQLFFKPFDMFKTEFADTEAETINEEVATEVIPTMTGDHIEPTLDLIAKVKDGTLTQEQAIVFMNQFLKFPMDIAQGFFSETPVATFQELSSKKKDERPKLTDEMSAYFLSKLEECAEKNDDNAWELLIDEKASEVSLKTIDDIDRKPTKRMMAEAKKGLEMRKEFGRGGTEVGVARARDIMNGKNLSVETIKRMYSFFSRHEASVKKGKGFKKGDEGYPSAGKIAWLLWGGETGFDWAKRKVKEIENVQQNMHKFANKMPTKSMADADAQSQLDVGLYKVRYYYQKTNNVPNKPGNKSRKFCDIMMEWSGQGLEWTFEDIQKMSDDAVNGEFAMKGQSRYDLFEYKGGCYCRHGWMRRIYFRKRNPDGTFMPSKGLDNEIRVGNNPFIRQKGSEAVAPYDMPNHAKVNPPFMKD